MELPIKTLHGFDRELANALVVLSSTAEDGEIEVRIGPSSLSSSYGSFPEGQWSLTHVFQPASWLFTSKPSPHEASMMTPMAGAMGTAGVSMQAAMGNTQLYSQVGNVSYPTPRALNPTAFSNTTVANVPAATVAAPNTSAKQRVFTGTVTKVHDNFGFVDEDVFFQTSCCVKGSNPQVGDRVLVEASYNPNMPFKWNATRIQVLPTTSNNNSRGGGGGGLQQSPGNNMMKGFSNIGPNSYNAVPPPSDSSNSGGGFGGRGPHPSRKPMTRRERSRDRKDTEEEDVERKKRREERAKEREEKDKRSPSVRRRSKSPRPRPARRTRIVPRYMVHIPKICLDLPEADVLELRRRYNNMYVPSDFFSTNFRWVDAFPPHTPFTLDQSCSFHVMNKEVDPVIENNTVLEPPDADYIFSAKVMLMSMPTMEEIFKKCCSLAEDKEKERENDDARDFVHPTRLVNFLVGLRGKNETMAIGGPWSPSLDGQDPEKDPSVLVKTAIRTCRALTGVDLSHCTQWYRFLEIYYRRAETTHKGRLVPARVETVVLFLPDVWSCVPARLEWDGLHHNYKKQLERRLKAEQDIAAGVTTEEKAQTSSSKKKKSHKLVTELRTELEARLLSPKGLKSQLIARLTKTLKTEQDKAEEENPQPCFLYYLTYSLYSYSFPDNFIPNLISPNNMLLTNFIPMSSTFLVSLTFNIQCFCGMCDNGYKDDDNSKDGRRDKDKKSSLDRDKEKKKKEKVKLYTDDPNLLLSFVYFDQSHCGYIFDKDIEELLYTLGLNLSRAQVRKLVQKVVTRDSLHYRKLTDKPKKEEEAAGKEPLDVKDKPKEEKKETDPEALAALAYGNKRLLPVFEVGGSPPSKRARKDMDESKESVALPDGYTMFRGSLLHVDQLREQLKRSEKARIDTETKMLSLREELKEVKDKAVKTSISAKELATNLTLTSKKLRHTENELAKMKANSEAFYEALEGIHEKVVPLLAETDVREVNRRYLEEDECDSPPPTLRRLGREDGQVSSRWSDTVEPSHFKARTTLSKMKKDKTPVVVKVKEEEHQEACEDKFAEIEEVTAEDHTDKELKIETEDTGDKEEEENTETKDDDIMDIE
uniref:(California timema) hypothetical protein n=1 Tax=Timema californicum TaxID=61474 RepID=A0A7R9J576_TIMCA|nr:unnamed protein product [Timema californicum]